MNFKQRILETVEQNVIWNLNMILIKGIASSLIADMYWYCSNFQGAL